MLEDGTRNTIRIQRLKDKLGNRSNASSEVEYDQTWGWMVGEEGRGVRTIIEMVSHTRLDCTIGTASQMRAAVVQALHFTSHRSAFGKLLKDQPLMANVLADLALESEAAATVLLRMARAYDDAAREPAQRSFLRITTAIGKYWVCKRGMGVVAEALECLGGMGYVEESGLPRIYREVPVSSVWEGSGNVMCLDVLRAMGREPDSLTAFLVELDHAKGANRFYDAHLQRVKEEIRNQADLELRARRVVESLATALQANLLLRHAPNFVADAFCATRLGGEHGLEYGTLPPGTQAEKLVERALPRL
jgi:putative acyl-CoA dehydrogenase